MVARRRRIVVTEAALTDESDYGGDFGKQEIRFVPSHWLPLPPPMPIAAPEAGRAR